jgi:hypothetical protein
MTEFEKKELEPLVFPLSITDNRAQFFYANYLRGKANAETLLLIKNSRGIQSIATVARALFELAVDVKLIAVIPNAIDKVVSFTDVERLRAAKKIVAFKAANPTAIVDDRVHQAFIKAEATRIDDDRALRWPGMTRVKHWSGKDLAQRVALLGRPFDEFYEVEYPELSWYVHAGLVGFINLDPATIDMLAAKQNKLAAECYEILLTAIIDEFNFETIDPKIKSRMTLAKMLPFADSQELRNQIVKELLG